MVGKVANDRGCYGLEEREETPECTSEQNDIISGFDRASEGGFVGVEVLENARKQGGRLVCSGATWGRFDVAVELEELREER